MYDVAIIGMGLAGSIAATCLGRTGFKVAQIGRYADPPEEFAAEQIVGSQVVQLRQLGVLDAIVKDAPEICHVDAARDGRIFETMFEPHYGLSYCNMIRGARSAVPNTVDTFCGAAVDIATTPSHQKVQMADGRVIFARLLILATGIRPLAAFGFGQQMIRKQHSLTIGFDITGSDYGNVLAYFPEHFGDRIDYLTLFPMGGRLRGNLFLYREVSDEWVRLFRLSPNYCLNQRFPGLKRVIGSHGVGDHIQVRPVSLYKATELANPGVVVIGGAYQSSCPAVGSGIGRIATDVDLLCNFYVPLWLRHDNTSLDWDTFKSFYNDPIKVSVDKEALRAAEYRRKLATETGLGWKLHRSRVKVQNAVRKWRGGKAPAFTPPSMMVGV